MTKIIVVFAVVLMLGGCFATVQEFSENMESKFVGRNVDNIVSEFGPPINSFKMNSGETSYVWELGSQTNINTYRGSGTAQTYFCKVNVVASPIGIVTKLFTEDSYDRFGQSQCASRLGMQRKT